MNTNTNSALEWCIKHLAHNHNYTPGEISREFKIYYYDILNVNNAYDSVAKKIDWELVALEFNAFVNKERSALNIWIRV